MDSIRTIGTGAVGVVGVIVALASAVLLFRGGAADGGLGLATLSASFNDVSTRRARSLSFQAGQVGEALFTRDAVKTGTDSRAVVTYDSSGTVLQVDPASLVVITAPESFGVQAIILENGAFSGQVRNQVGAPRSVQILDKAGQPVATLVPVAAAGEELKYRVRALGGDRTEVAVLKGAAEITQGSKKVLVGRGQVVELSKASEAAPEVELLPAFPISEAPGVDARFDLAGSAQRTVALSWGPADRAQKFHLQVGRQLGSGFAFEKIALESESGERAATFEPKEAGTYLWRVAGLDEKGREGEFGYARRFTIVALPGQEAAPAPAPAPAEPAAGAAPAAGTQEVAAAPVKLQAKVTGELSRQQKGGAAGALKGTVTVADGDSFSAAGYSSLGFERSNLVLNPGSQANLLGAQALDGKRKRVELALAKGSLVTDLDGKAEFAAVSLAAGPAQVRAEGARLRTELRGDGARVICERGDTEVSGAGKSVKLAAGQAVDVGAAGPGEVSQLPTAPSLSEPSDGKSYDAVEGSPKVDFAWAAAPGASRYSFVISRAKNLGDPVVEENLTGTTYSINTLRPGRYYWGVYAVDGKELQSLPPAARLFSLVKDEKGPSISIVAPAENATTTEERIDVVGKTSPGTKVKVNLKDVEVDESGNFRASVPLLLGPNSVNVEAIAPSGKSDIKYVRVRRE